MGSNGAFEPNHVQVYSSSAYRIEREKKIVVSRTLNARENPEAQSRYYRLQTQP